MRKGIIKEKVIFHLFLIFIFSVILMIPMFFHFSYVGHDMEFHFLNIKSIVAQLSWNNWFAVEPLPFLANNFGYGTRFFYPPLPHLFAAYITKIFHINNILFSIRIVDWVVLFFSGASFYLMARKLFKDKRVILLGTFFYMSAPYHLAEIYIRNAFSEMFLFVSVPLVILGLFELKESNYKNFYVYFTLGYTISIYSHMAMSIYFTLILLSTFFVVYMKQVLKKRAIMYLLLSCFSVLCLTSPFWLRMLEMKLSTLYTIFVPYFLTGKGDLQFSTLSLSDYFHFFLPHNYGFIRYHLSFSVTILICGSLFFFLRDRLCKNRFYLFLFWFFILSIIMTTKIFPWAYIPNLLHTLQFPWRLTLFVQFSGIILAMYFLERISSNKYFPIFFILLTLLCIFEMYYNTYHLDKRFDENNINVDLGMGNQKEYLPHKTTLNIEYFQNRDQSIHVLDGSAHIDIIENQVPGMIFEVDVEQESIIELPRLYYAGYQLTYDHSSIPLIESNFGFLQANITESGIYTLEYKGTLCQKISKLLAFIVLAFYVLLFIFRKRIKWLKV